MNLEAQPKKHVAKNVVILIGDGMGISTITATRIYKGQRVYGKSGEDHKLVFDAFPNVALVKVDNIRNLIMFFSFWFLDLQRRFSSYRFCSVSHSVIYRCTYIYFFILLRFFYVNLHVNNKCLIRTMHFIDLSL